MPDGGGVCKAAKGFVMIAYLSDTRCWQRHAGDVGVPVAEMDRRIRGRALLRRLCGLTLELVVALSVSLTLRILEPVSGAT